MYFEVYGKKKTCFYQCPVSDTMTWVIVLCVKLAFYDGTPINNNDNNVLRETVASSVEIFTTFTITWENSMPGLSGLGEIKLSLRLKRTNCLG